MLWQAKVNYADRGLVAAALLLALLFAATLLSGAPAQAQDKWVRAAEPVEVTGDMLSEHSGVPLDELAIYVYLGGEWSAIPFQFDEVDSTGSYTTTEDGMLDDDDVLVFMAQDLGEQAGRQWLDNEEARRNARTEIHVVDPSEAGGEGWAYVYRLPTPELALTDYVDWNADLERVQAISYTLGFSPSVHAGIEFLAFKGQEVDVLDRTKIRVVATCIVLVVPQVITLTEEDLVGLVDPTPRIDGPVRVGGGSAEGTWWYYGQHYQSNLVLDVTALEPPNICTSLEINSVRLSTDWRDPAATGMSPTIYYDGNVTDGVVVDGVTDAVPQEPVSWWKQISGDRGSLVFLSHAELEGGNVFNYYLDDAAVDPAEPGDGQSYGDAGFQVLDPAGTAVVEMKAIILGPNQPNVGETYAGYQAAPLQVTATGQSFYLGTYLPLVMREHR